MPILATAVNAIVQHQSAAEAQAERIALLEAQVSRLTVLGSALTARLKAAEAQIGAINAAAREGDEPSTTSRGETARDDGEAAGASRPAQSPPPHRSFFKRLAGFLLHRR